MKSNENRSSVSRFVPCGRVYWRTDRYDRSKSRFSQFYERPSNVDVHVKPNMHLPYSRLQRVTITEAVIIQFVLLIMSKVLLETCWGL